MARFPSKRHMATSLAVAASLVATIGDAAVYKSIDIHGATAYSGRPSPEARRIELPPVSIVAFSTPPVQARSATTSTAKAYLDISIVAPVHDETVRSNAGTIAVELSVATKLEAADTLTILLDGEPVHEGARTLAFPLINVDRGTHSLQAMVVGASGRELARSPSVTFHLQRVSILNAPAF